MQVEYNSSRRNLKLSWAVSCDRFGIMRGRKFSSVEAGEERREDLADKNVPSNDLFTSLVLWR